MADYTMQLRSYIESFSQHEDGLSWKDKIETGREHLFDFDYPFFDEEYKGIFETNIIRKFYMREIGFETEGLFKFQLETWLNINMPYYNNLFRSEQIKYDPLTNTEMFVAHEQGNEVTRGDKRDISQVSNTEGENNGDIIQDSTSSGNRNDDSFTRKVASDNPDGRLQLQTQDGRGVIEYASDIDENKGNASSSTDGKSNTKSKTTDTTNVTSNGKQTDEYSQNRNEREHFLQRRFGKIGSETYAKMMNEYRNSLIRIENMVHKELQQLFMLIY